MRLPLQLHPESDCDAVTAIEVDVTRLAPRRIGLRFELSGATRHVAWPRPSGPPRQAQNLWLHTCFEAFVRVADEDSYLEVNLSPSGQWAAYRFAGYRAGMNSADQVGLPRIDADNRYAPPIARLAATLELERLGELWIDRPWHLGLSAVIEERNGRLSYWALAHPPGKPDFHHPDCFALELPAARPSPSPRT